MALSAAGRQPHEISLIETHGTGTALGDPIEVRSLRHVLMRGRGDGLPCWLGAVKTNIGHLESAPRIVLEAGPKPVLTALGKSCAPDAPMVWLPSLRGPDDTAACCWRPWAECSNWAWRSIGSSSLATIIAQKSACRPIRSSVNAAGPTDPSRR